MNKEIEKAIQILQADGVVAIPTETVYGLAASIDSPTGLENIFSIKERPFFDPLIVHVASISQAKSCTSNWPSLCDQLAENFWPGPLTMILPKAKKINDKITSGLDTVGIRFPDHHLTLELIKRLGSPVAAPSANKFKKISPTTEEHVTSEFPDIFVLSGGACQVGIESTIVGVEGDHITIYRPGMITKNMIQQAIPEAFVTYQESPIAPGHLKQHYMPKLPVILKLASSDVTHPFKCPVRWIIDNDPIQVARELYSTLRELDKKEHDCIEIILREEYLEQDTFRGILNRLIKASYLKSPLIKPEY